MDLGGNEVIKDDRAESQQADPDFSHGGLGDDLRNFLAEPADGVSQSPTKPVHTRNLRATFRAVPGTDSGSALDPGFPGTKAFSARGLDRGATRTTLQSAPGRADAASAPAPRADDLEGRRVALQQAGGAATAIRPAVAAAESPTGGDVRGRRPSGRSGTAVGSADRSAGRRGRPPGSGKKPITASLPKAIAKLVPKSDAPVSASKLIPTETERADARRLFREIGQRFNDNRKKSKTAAYAGFRHDLMDNLDTLVMGGAIDLKEATSIITNLEQYTKETEAESTETPATILGRWLRMDASEAAGLSVPVEEVVEDEENLDVEEEDELDEPADPVQDIFI